MNAYGPTPAQSFGGPAFTAARSAAWRLATLLAAPFAAIARQQRIHRTALMLQELDDRTLSDIGLHRTQINATSVRLVDWPHVDPRRVDR
ncbi:MAG TPA: DUF1127 domain-containing protein [Thalassobaculum sp.]